MRRSGAPPGISRAGLWKFGEVGDFKRRGRKINVNSGAGCRRLRALREASGLNAIEWALRVGCPVGTVVRAEMGLQVPRKPGERARLAEAYGISLREFLRMALDAADDHERRA